MTIQTTFYEHSCYGTKLRFHPRISLSLISMGRWVHNNYSNTVYTVYILCIYVHTLYVQLYIRTYIHTYVCTVYSNNWTSRGKDEIWGKTSFGEKRIWSSGGRGECWVGWGVSGNYKGNFLKIIRTTLYIVGWSTLKLTWNLTRDVQQRIRNKWGMWPCSLAVVLVADGRLPCPYFMNLLQWMRQVTTFVVL